MQMAEDSGSNGTDIKGLVAELLLFHFFVKQSPEFILYKPLKRTVSRACHSLHCHRHTNVHTVLTQTSIPKMLPLLKVQLHVTNM